VPSLTVLFPTAISLFWHILRAKQAAEDILGAFCMQFGDVWAVGQTWLILTILALVGAKQVAEGIIGAFFV
jgi:hypothetical protein